MSFVLHKLAPPSGSLRDLIRAQEKATREAIRKAVRDRDRETRRVLSGHNGT